jgi:hypothetical protein
MCDTVMYWCCKSNELCIIRHFLIIPRSVLMNYACWYIFRGSCINKHVSDTQKRKRQTTWSRVSVRFAMLRYASNNLFFYYQNASGINKRDTAININPLTPELNPSAQRYLTRYFTGDFASWTMHFVNICVKTNNCNNYSFSLLIMYGSSYMFRHYSVMFKERSEYRVCGGVLWCRGEWIVFWGLHTYIHVMPYVYCCKYCWLTS